MRTREVSLISGVTLRQLQWWADRGFVTPRQRRGTREYTRAEAALVAVAAAMRRKGFSPSIMFSLRDCLQSAINDYLKLRKRSFLIVGRSVCLCDDAEVAQLAAKELGFVLVLDLASTLGKAKLLGATE